MLGENSLRCHKNYLIWWLFSSCAFVKKCRKVRSFRRVFPTDKPRVSQRKEGSWWCDITTYNLDVLVIYWCSRCGLLPCSLSILHLYGTLTRKSPSHFIFHKYCFINYHRPRLASSVISSPFRRGSTAPCRGDSAASKICKKRRSRKRCLHVKEYPFPEC